MVREIVVGGDELGMSAHAGDPGVQAQAGPGEIRPADGEGRPEALQRHPALSHLFGQKKLLDRLQRLADGCAAAGRPMPPILLVGPSGGGKTEVARAVSGLLGVESRYLNSNKSVSLTGLLDMLAGMQPLDVAIFDEVDKLRNDCQVAMLSILENRPVNRPPQTGRHREPERAVDLPPLSFVATTTRPGKMLCDLLNRFMVLEVEPYGSGDLAAMCLRVAESEGKVLEQDGAELLSGSCFGVPREVRKRTQELCITCEKQMMTRADVVAFLHERGIHHEGWTALHYKLLGLIKGGASKARIYSQAGLDPVLVESYEAQLVKAGLIEIQPAHGRVLTANGRITLMLLKHLFR